MGVNLKFFDELLWVNLNLIEFKLIRGVKYWYFLFI